MALINPKITLLIAEELGASDISALMLTCKANHAILKTYETSVAKAIMRRMDLAAVLATPVLDLYDPTRIFERASFELVAELERRAQGAETLIALCILLNGWVTTAFVAPFLQL
jgi:hypothetical protein